MPAPETNIDDRVQNTSEAELIHIISEALCTTGVPEDHIGVITVYRAQLRLLNNRLKQRPGIEVLTADKSQGRDKDCVIISLVRANEGNTIGDLLRDWRRLNVTFTRAKSKLIIIGSRRTLESSNVLKAFLDVIDENGWAYVLPNKAEQLYTLPNVNSHPSLTPPRFKENQSENKRSSTSFSQGSPSRSLKHPKVQVVAKNPRGVKGLLAKTGGKSFAQDVVAELGFDHNSQH